jgi:dynein heavy chain
LLEWQEDLKNLYKTLGIDNKKVVFTFADKDIKDEVFFEDINSILNVGELTSLFNIEDMEEIQYELEKQLKKSKAKI